MILSHHHALLDGWSMPILVREVFALYDAARLGTVARVGRVRPYREYLEWLKNRDASAEESFWHRLLAGFQAPTPLADDRTPKEGQEEYAKQGLELSDLATEELTQLARQHQLTLATLVQAAWAILLGRYSGERDVVFGAVTSGRSAPVTGIETMIGLFINTLPVRVELPTHMEVSELLEGLHLRQAEMQRREHTPLAAVRGWSEVPRDQELFESIFAFQNFPVDEAVGEAAPGGLTVRGNAFAEWTHYPLSLMASVRRHCTLSITYDRTRFDHVTVRRMLDHLGRLLREMPATPGRTLGSLSVLGAAERHQVLREWSETAGPTAEGHELVHQLAARQVGRRPAAVAISDPEGSLSYSELGRRSRRLASRLRRAGVAPEVRVALLFERSSWLFTAQLAVLEAGGAFVPLDPKTPGERLAFQVEDAGVPIVLTSRALADRVPRTPARVIEVDADQADEADKAPDRGSPEHLAYVIYTSGSTGRPKGVEILHHSLSQLVAWHRRHYQIGAGDRAAVVASPSFDASIFETWPYLTSGARLVIPEPDTVLAPDRWVELLSRERVTFATTAAPLAEATLAELSRAPKAAKTLPCLRVVTSGGDRLRRTPDRPLGFALVNHYGPTECTVVTTGVEIPPGTETPPIGWPVGGRRIALLNAGPEPVPMGTAGHLHVAGPGLARGYLGRAARTAESFVPDPYADRAGERLYRTGDLARHRGDGQLEFLGRIDHQVKIRGFRIELGEIEAILAQQPSVREAVVMVREEEHRRLVAFVVPEHDTSDFQTAELRTALTVRLPDYMVPSLFVTVERFPVTIHGKLDRRALARLAHDASPAATGGKAAPRNAGRTSPGAGLAQDPRARGGRRPRQLLRARRRLHPEHPGGVAGGRRGLARLAARRLPPSDGRRPGQRSRGGRSPHRSRGRTGRGRGAPAADPTPVPRTGHAAKGALQPGASFRACRP